MLGVGRVDDGISGSATWVNSDWPTAYSVHVTVPATSRTIVSATPSGQATTVWLTVTPSPSHWPVYLVT